MTPGLLLAVGGALGYGVMLGVWLYSMRAYRRRAIG